MPIVALRIDHSRMTMNYFQPVIYSITESGATGGFDYLSVTMNAFSTGGGEMLINLYDYDSRNNPDLLYTKHTSAREMMTTLDADIKLNLQAAGIVVVDKTGLINPAPANVVDHYVIKDVTKEAVPAEGPWTRTTSLRFRTRLPGAVPIFLNAQSFARTWALQTYPKGTIVL